MSFDPNAFLESTEVQGAMETKFVRIPPGDYQAMISNVEGREAVFTPKKGPRAGQEVRQPCVDITYSIDVGVGDGTKVKEATGMDTPSITQGIFLDVNAAGQLEMGPGKNINLGRLRAACGLNDPSKSFKFGMLKGQIVKIKVDQVPNPNDPNDPYSNVTGVTAV